LDSSKFLPLKNEEIHIVAVTDEYALEKWVETVASGFGLRNDYVGQFYLPIFQNKPTHFEFFLGVFGNMPVTACYLYRGTHSAQIHSLATIKNFRNKKAATTMVCTLIARELSKKTQEICLEANDVSLKLFSNIGFRVLAECDLLVHAKDDQDF
jgi:hypothetical protein